MPKTISQVSIDGKEKELRARLPKTCSIHERKALIEVLLRQGNGIEEVCEALPDKQRRCIKRCIKKVFTDEKLDLCKQSRKDPGRSGQMRSRRDKYEQDRSTV